MNTVRINPASRTYDASYLTDFLRCEKRTYWKHVFRGVGGIQPQVESISLAYGSALHDCMYHWSKGHSLEESIAIGIKRFAECGQEDEKRSFLKFDELVRAYAHKWGKLPTMRTRTDGSLMTEIEFGLSLEGGMTLVGRLDGITDIEGRPGIIDYKTTSSFSDSYIRKYRRDLQMLLYAFAAREMIGECSGILVDMLLVSPTKIRLENGEGKREIRNIDNFFLRLPIKVENEVLDCTMKTLQILDKRVQRCFNENEWIENLNDCFNYGECPYSFLCEMPSRADAIIEVKYKTREEAK